ncbi:MAG TPA: hypothetical protein VM533_15990 [Fimbriiglobus sp.]|jgi:hypothetical protein|nr:hypothetical protein [Fimbriiglobus sp.]
MADQPEKKEPVEPITPPPRPSPSAPDGRRGYVIESGEDVVLTIDVTNYQEFVGQAICDPEELAKLTRPSQP